jgi:hypothetical protein
MDQLSRRVLLKTLAGVSTSTLWPGTGFGQPNTLRLADYVARLHLAAAADAGPAIRAALADAAAAGGGTILLDDIDYFVLVRDENDLLLIESRNINLRAERGATIRWDHYGCPLIAILGADNCLLENLTFEWAGTRGRPPGKAMVRGYDGSGIISPPDICAHVLVGGSNNVTIRNVAWRGQTHNNNLEAGLVFYNGSRNGPDRSSRNVNNRVLNIKSADVYFGITMFGQSKFAINEVNSREYMIAGHVGAGHVIYVTGICDQGTISNVHDEGIPLESPGTNGLTAVSVQTRSINRCTIKNITSRRADGVFSILNDSSDNEISNIRWAADRTAFERGLGNGCAITIAQGNTSASISRNTFRDWHLADLPNPALGRSANVGIIGVSGAIYSARRAVENHFLNIQISYAPGPEHSKNPFQSYGTRCDYQAKITNIGIADKECFRLLSGSEGDESTDCIVSLKLSGKRTRARVGCPRGSGNSFRIDTPDRRPPEGEIALGNSVQLFALK